MYANCVSQKFPVLQDLTLRLLPVDEQQEVGLSVRVRPCDTSSERSARGAGRKLLIRGAASSITFYGLQSLSDAIRSDLSTCCCSSVTVTNDCNVRDSFLSHVLRARG